MNRTDLITLKFLILRFWKKLFHGHHAAFFPAQFCNSVWKQCNTLQLNCNLPSHYWNTVSLLTVHQTITLNFLIMKTSYESNKKCHCNKKMPLESLFWLWSFPLHDLKKCHFRLFMIWTIEDFQEFCSLFRSFSVTSISCFETTFSNPPIGNVYIFGWLPEWTH